MKKILLTFILLMQTAVVIAGVTRTPHPTASNGITKVEIVVTDNVTGAVTFIVYVWYDQNNRLVASEVIYENDEDQRFER